MSQLSTTTMNWQHNTKARTGADWNAHPHTTAKHPKRKKKHTHNYNRTHKNQKRLFFCTSSPLHLKASEQPVWTFHIHPGRTCPLFESFFTVHQRGSTNDLATPSRHSSSTLLHWNKIRIMRKEKKKKKRWKRTWITASACSSGTWRDRSKSNVETVEFFQTVNLWFTYVCSRKAPLYLFSISVCVDCAWLITLLLCYCHQNDNEA